MRGYLKSRQFVQLFQLVASNTNTTQYPAIVWGPIENNETSCAFHRLTHTHTNTHKWTQGVLRCNSKASQRANIPQLDATLSYCLSIHIQHTWLHTSIPLHMNTHTHNVLYTCTRADTVHVCALYCIPYASSSTRFVLKRLWMRYYNAIKSTTHTPPVTRGSTLRRTWTWQRRWNRTGSPTRDKTCTYSD